MSATILRCADGDWLTGASGVDRPLWNEWHAARPFAQPVMAWWRNFATAVNAPVRSPLFFVRDRGQSHAVSIADAVRTHAQAAGAGTQEYWLEGSCREAGAVAQQRAFEKERELLR